MLAAFQSELVHVHRVLIFRIFVRYPFEIGIEKLWKINS